ncbi:LytR/AlgR family response regulator transcription factor [Flaviaesturariibacter aridisoli]|uniref:Response regulator transcription factor n=1 Tax=Flaviaesturariibacter aridisoli TaxID=2545761 RepID=A0A4R4DUZ2_9BACT|nr:LytTR family DNA-binding domain-containing protein [Flaviaesturariibacter aridisoli]TCZ67048.1 response regulator transcription factor [Flaviaesturariibacter aridisoli]
MSKLTCIIVEDEPLAVKVLSGYIAQVPYLELAGTFSDALLTSEYLRGHRVDLMFLDLHLPKLKGMDFLRTLAHPPAVIVITAYHQYAVEGFERNVTDYLLKPVSFERFLVAVNKVGPAAAATPAATAATPPSEKDHLFLSIQKKKVKVPFADILYVESQREYVRVVTLRGEYLTKMSTHELEALLPPARFRRIHRSFIVAVDRIDAYTAEEVEVGGVSIPVGRGYRDGLGLL